MKVHFYLDPEIVKQIDDYWHEHRINSRSEAIRDLLKAALGKTRPKPTSSARDAK